MDGAGVRSEAPRRPDGDHKVVAGPVADRPEVGVQQTVTLVDVEQLVRLAVPVEHGRGHRVGRSDDAHDDVAVEEERDPSGDGVAVRLDPGCIDQSMVVIAVVGFLDGDDGDRFDPMRPGRGYQVVEER